MESKIRYMFRGMDHEGKWHYGATTYGQTQIIEFPPPRAVPIIASTLGQAVVLPIRDSWRKEDHEQFGMIAFEGDILRMTSCYDDWHPESQHPTEIEGILCYDEPSMAWIVVEERDTEGNAMHWASPSDFACIDIIGDVYNTPKRME